MHRVSTTTNADHELETMDESLTATIKQVIAEADLDMGLTSEVDEVVLPAYPFPRAFRSGWDSVKNRPIYAATIPPLSQGFTVDRKPMSTQEFKDAAGRTGINFSHWITARILRHVMQAAGYRLGLAA